MMRALLSQGVHLALALCFTASALPDELPDYQPRRVSPPIDASYVSADRSITIIGSDGTRNLLRKFNELFVATHPGLKITLLARGLPSIALYGIITGTSAFALMAELRGCRARRSSVPTASTGRAQSRVR